MVSGGLRDEKVGLGENGSVAEEHAELGCWVERSVSQTLEGLQGSVLHKPHRPSRNALSQPLSDKVVYRVDVALDTMFTNPQGTTSLNEPQYFPSQELGSKFINTGLILSSHSVPRAGVDRIRNAMDWCVELTVGLERSEIHHVLSALFELGVDVGMGVEKQYTYLFIRGARMGVALMENGLKMPLRYKM